MLEKLAEADRTFIKTQVEAGYYTSEIEVVRDAVRRMREGNERYKLETIRSLLKVAHEQIQRGEQVPYTSDLLDQSFERALNNHKNNKRIRDEVRP